MFENRCYGIAAQLYLEYNNTVQDDVDPVREGTKPPACLQIVVTFK